MGRHGAGIASPQQLQGAGVGGNPVGIKLNPNAGGRRLHHLPQMPQQPKTGHVRAGTASMAAQEMHQVLLGSTHDGKGLIHPGRWCAMGLGGSHDDPTAQRAAEHQRIPWLEGAFAPALVGLYMAMDTDSKAELKGQGLAGIRVDHGLQAVPTQNFTPQLLGSDPDSSQTLGQQVLLQCGVAAGQGHQGLEAVQTGATGPEITGSVQEGEPSVEPGITHQGREAVQTGQEQLVRGAPGNGSGVLGLWTGTVELGQGIVQGLGRELGGAAAAGHGLPGPCCTCCHGCGAIDHGHEAVVQVLLPPPEPWVGT